MLELLRSICRQDGITAIVSLHQLEYARRFSDRIVGLADARVAFDTTAAELSDAHLARIYGRGERHYLPGECAPRTQPVLEPKMEVSL